MKNELQADQVDLPLDISVRLEYVARQKLNFHDHKGDGVYDLQKQRELQQHGTRMLKWALLGCWKEGERSLDGVVQAMIKVGAAGNIDEATTLIEQMARRSFHLDTGIRYDFKGFMGHKSKYGKCLKVHKQSDGTYKIELDSFEIT
ncbi:hypothetical protein J4208_04200 [Candidatus Woesearchaeota archaeon]|nr:hypothetical protein [Candidatus Woesearchaeota archaeon]